MEKQLQSDGKALNKIRRVLGTLRKGNRQAIENRVKKQRKSDGNVIIRQALRKQRKHNKKTLDKQWRGNRQAMKEHQETTATKNETNENNTFVNKWNHIGKAFQQDTTKRRTKWKSN